MQIRSYRLTVSNKLALVGLLAAAFLVGGALIVLGLTLLIGFVLVAVALGIGASIYRGLHRGRSGFVGPVHRYRLDPANEVSLPPGETTSEDRRITGTR